VTGQETDRGIWPRCCVAVQKRAVPVLVLTCAGDSTDYLRDVCGNGTCLGVAYPVMEESVFLLSMRADLLPETCSSLNESL